MVVIDLERLFALPQHAGDLSVGHPVVVAEVEDQPLLERQLQDRLLETYQRRLHYNDSDEGQDVGLELAKRARLEKYMQREVIIAQRQELFRLRRAHNISDTTFYEVLREIDLKEESLR